MKKFISNGKDIYMRVTGENQSHYVCGMVLFPKADVITEYYPLDDMTDKLHLHVVPFYN